MGQALCCCLVREDSNPLLDAEARARAAEAAQGRLEKYNSSPSAQKQRQYDARLKKAAASSVSAESHAQRINDIIN